MGRFIKNAWVEMVVYSNGLPQIGWFIMENLMNMEDLRVPPNFRNLPNGVVTNLGSQFPPVSTLDVSSFMDLHGWY